MKCPHCTGHYKKDDMELQWVHELCGERVPAVDPTAVIEAAREVQMIMMDGEFKSRFACLRKLHDALAAYDMEAGK